MTTKKEAARKHKIAQAQKLIDLFTEANGRPPRSAEELNKWVSSPEGKAATAYDRTPDGKVIP
jgi:hypothetical protein